MHNIWKIFNTYEVPADFMQLIMVTDFMWTEMKALRRPGGYR
jgi:hypothetical protein